MTDRDTSGHAPLTDDEVRASLTPEALEVLTKSIRAEVAREMPSFIRIGISSGSYDEMLTEIESLVRRRNAVLASQKVASLSIGQRIYISESVRPKLLAGAACEVIDFEGTDKVKVRLLVTRSDRWREGNIFTLGKTLVGDVSR